MAGQYSESKHKLESLQSKLRIRIEELEHQFNVQGLQELRKEQKPEMENIKLNSNTEMLSSSLYELHTRIEELELQFGLQQLRKEQMPTITYSSKMEDIKLNSYDNLESKLKTRVEELEQLVKLQELQGKQELLAALSSVMKDTIERKLRSGIEILASLQSKLINQSKVKIEVIEEKLISGTQVLTSLRLKFEGMKVQRNATSEELDNLQSEYQILKQELNSDKKKNSLYFKTKMNLEKTKCKLQSQMAVLVKFNDDCNAKLDNIKVKLNSNVFNLLQIMIKTHEQKGLYA